MDVKKGLGFARRTMGRMMDNVGRTLEERNRKRRLPDDATGDTVPIPANGQRGSVRPLAYDGSADGPPRTMEYDPQRDGRADETLPPAQRWDPSQAEPMDDGWTPMDSDDSRTDSGLGQWSGSYNMDDTGGPYDDELPYDGEDPGWEEYGKAEENRKPRYSNKRSEDGRPVPAERQWRMDEVYDSAKRRKPITSGPDANPTEVDQWKRSVYAEARAAGLTPEEADQVVNDLMNEG